MPRAPRVDEPGSWHHVMNRGLARRTVFETDADIRYFLSRIARVVRRGELELHSYAILTTHFHLLLRSLGAGLSNAMQWIEHGYVRWFNRRRRRDGPLFRGRFRSQRVASATHWRTVLAYIDENPVEAGLSKLPTTYPWCSAHHYARSVGPRWLRRDEVESAAAIAAGTRRFSPDTYLSFATIRRPAAARYLVTRTAGSSAVRAAEELDDLVRAAPPRVADWMRRKARLADGCTVGEIVAAPEAVRSAVDAALVGPARDVGFVGRRPELELLLMAGLLRQCCGLRFHEIAHRLARSTTKAHDLVTEHVHRLDADPAYAGLAADAASDAIRASFGVDGAATRVAIRGVRTPP